MLPREQALQWPAQRGMRRCSEKQNDGFSWLLRSRMEDLETSIVCRCSVRFSARGDAHTWEDAHKWVSSVHQGMDRERKVAARQFLASTTTMENTTSKEQNPEKQVEGANEGETKDQNAAEDVRLHCCFCQSHSESLTLLRCCSRPSSTESGEEMHLFCTM